MSSINKFSPLSESFPVVEAIKNLSVDDASDATDQVEKIEPSMTTPEGTSETGDEVLKHSNDQIFVKTDAADDVFGRDVTIPTMPRPDAENIASRISVNLDDIKATSDIDKQAPRADRINDPITPANAQGVLPPEACVFAANLSMMRSDEQLEYSCHQAFDVFGKCLIKVRRDKHRHPFALVQYYNAKDAASAIEGARKLVVDGRHIRTEPAQARRSIILVKVHCGTPTMEEARALLQEYGPIEKIYPTTNGDALRLGVPAGMWVQFAYYLDYKDAVKFFDSTNNDFRLHVPPEAGSSGRSNHNSSPTRQIYRTPRSSTDHKSIFVGNLPYDANEAELQSIFAQFGDIKAVNVIHKPIQGGTGYNVFGFVEFADSKQASQAAEQEVDLRGQRIRVEPKEYSARRHSRLNQYQQSPPYTNSPRYSNKPWYNDNMNTNQMHNLYSSPSMPMQYTPSQQEFWDMSPMPRMYHQMPQAMSPYQGNAYGNAPMFATPPASNRAVRQNPFMGSPNVMPYMTPEQYQTSYTPLNSMGPIPEEYTQGQNTF